MVEPSEGTGVASFLALNDGTMCWMCFWSVYYFRYQLRCDSPVRDIEPDHFAWSYYGS